MAYRNSTLLSRFLSQVEFGPECWFWIGCCTRDGYGKMSDGRARQIYAHRFSWEFFVGPIPGRLCALHRCDVRRCVNPLHLWLGTRADNQADMAKKLRCGGTKLTPDLVQEIRGSTETVVALAKRLGVSPHPIRMARLRRTWRHVD